MTAGDSAGVPSAASWLRRRSVPRFLPGARLVMLGHVLAKIWQTRGRRPMFRRALLELGFMEAALQTFGRTGIFNEGQSFYPLFLLPDYHGPHFEEALRRLLLPGLGPFVVHLGVTGVCPCRCEYCYAAAGGQNPPDLGDERLFEVARNLAGRGVPLVSLGGGEPLSRYERLLRLVEILAPTSEVRLATSGVGLTPARALELRQAGLRVLAVSLDSGEAAEVNRARGYPGAFEAAVAALRASSEAGLITFVTAVVGQSSFESPGSLERFLGFVASVDPKAVVNFIPKFWTGRAVSSGGFRTPEEYAPVAERLAWTIQEHGFRANVFLEPLELLMGCVGAGRRQLNLDIRGNVTACISGAAFGNIADEPFDTIYDRFAEEGGRLKRGFFCASIGEQAGAGRVLAPAESARALESFYSAHQDTLFQQLLDHIGSPLAWLAR